MLKITLTQYLVTVGTATVLYYAYVLARYRKLLGKSRGAQTEAASKPVGPGSSGYDPEAEDSEEPPFDIDESLFARAEELVFAIRGRIAQLPAGSSKEHVIGELRTLFAAYQDLNIPAFRPGITEHTLTVLNDYGSETLSEREIEGLW